MLISQIKNSKNTHSATAYTFLYIKELHFGLSFFKVVIPIFGKYT